ncbi:MAG: hypothetical protein HYS04_16785, partial [Acidobacteria bacterium]|nr:hypothetical protein [Acidobacteriota bacterium]
MKHTALFICALALPAAAQYAGSARWFEQMRQGARDMAMISALGRGTGREPLPPDYIEFAGVISFAKGNPFPGGHLPDLRIACRNRSADPVERSPHINDEDGSFYTVFKRGQVYDLSWMYYFGGREKFASIAIDADGPKQRMATFVYPSSGSVVADHPAGSPAASSPRPTTAAADLPARVAAPLAHGTGDSSWRQAGAIEPDKFDLSGFPARPRDFEEQRILDAIE